MASLQEHELTFKNHLHAYICIFSIHAMGFNPQISEPYNIMAHTLASKTLKKVFTGIYESSLKELNKCARTRCALIDIDSVILYNGSLFVKYTPT